MLHNCNEVEKLVACQEYVAITRGEEEEKKESALAEILAALHTRSLSLVFFFSILSPFLYAALLSPRLQERSAASIHRTDAGVFLTRVDFFAR